ncbi:MAG TPA: agmatinase [Blastocatellia bacterium]|nr:agmatinase [Blastocatellia bacterium]
MFIEKLKDKLKNVGDRRIALIGLPYDHNSSFLKGCSEAPPIIREALYCDSTNTWSENGIEVATDSVLFDAGDLPHFDTNDSFDMIDQAIELLLQHNLHPISLGGDHSITFPVIRAFSKRFQNLNILHFDAHPDNHHDFQSNPYSHASPFARIMENGLAKRLIQVGVRTISGHQREQAKRFGVEWVEMKDWRAGIKFDFDGPVYVSFDLDGLDPAFAPGVSHYEPGGLSTREAIAVIQSVKSPIVGADIVEFNPRRDINGMTAMVSSKMLKEIAAQMLVTLR